MSTWMEPLDQRPSCTSASELWGEGSSGSCSSKASSPLLLQICGRGAPAGSRPGWCWFCLCPDLTAQCEDTEHTPKDSGASQVAGMWLRWSWVCDLGRLRGATMRKVQKMSHKELPAFEVTQDTAEALYSHLFFHIPNRKSQWNGSRL